LSLRKGSVYPTARPIRARIARMTRTKYTSYMKRLTIHLPADLVDRIESEARCRGLSKSDVVRERLTSLVESPRGEALSLHGIADLIGSIDGLPSDLSRHTKRYLRSKIRDDQRRQRRRARSP
jgi:hypothetical protein